MAARRPQNQRPVAPRLISKPSQKSESQQAEVHQIVRILVPSVFKAYEIETPAQSSTESSPKDTTSELPSDWEKKVGMGTSTLWSQYGDNKGALTLYKGNRTVNDITVKIDEGDGFFSSTPILEGDPSAEPRDLFGPAPILGYPPAKCKSDF